MNRFSLDSTRFTVLADVWVGLTFELHGQHPGLTKLCFLVCRNSLLLFDVFQFLSLVLQFLWLAPGLEEGLNQYFVSQFNLIILATTSHFLHLKSNFFVPLNQP